MQSILSSTRSCSSVKQIIGNSSSSDQAPLTISRYLLLAANLHNKVAAERRRSLEPAKSSDIQQPERPPTADCAIVDSASNKISIQRFCIAVDGLKFLHALQQLPGKRSVRIIFIINITQTLLESQWYGDVSIIDTFGTLYGFPPLFFEQIISNSTRLSQTVNVLRCSLSYGRYVEASRFEREYFAIDQVEPSFLSLSFDAEMYSSIRAPRESLGVYFEWHNGTQLSGRQVQI